MRRSKNKIYKSNKEGFYVHAKVVEYSEFKCIEEVVADCFTNIERLMLTELTIWYYNLISFLILSAIPYFYIQIYT